MTYLRFLGLTAVACATMAVACTVEETEPTPTSSGTGGIGGSSSSASSTSGTAGSGGTGGTLIECPPGDSTNITVGCSLLQQDCPQGQTCDVVGTIAQCKAQSGLKGKGTDCTVQSECQAGLTCLPGLYKCAPFCCRSTDEPCEGGLCDVHQSYSGNYFAYVCSYRPSCTLLQDTCDDGLYCHVASVEKGIAVCDDPAGLVAEGETCQYRNNCGESQWCTNGVCRYHCSLSHWQENPGLGFGGCPAGQSCIPHWQLEQFPDIGVCMPT